MSENKNDKGYCRWVKCSERLPGKVYNYHVKIQYEFLPNKPGIWNTASLWNGTYWEHPTKYETFTGKPEKANVVEWLEEVPSLPVEADDKFEFVEWVTEHATRNKEGLWIHGFEDYDKPLTTSELYSLFNNQKQ